MIKKKPNVSFCKKCVAPSIEVVSSTLNFEGLCTGCIVSAEKKEINWNKRLNLLKKTLIKTNKDNNYDCVIPVSGGKDSYFQTHVIKNVLKMNPLLVTYNSNNYSKIGMENLINMREVFGVDHIFFTPSIKTIKKLNRIGMAFHGDMNWHGHAGILTYPIIIAVKFKIPFVIWGEHGWTELGGMYSHNDFIEFSKRDRKENGMHNLDWDDFIRASRKYGEKLSKEEMFPYIYPSDQEISDLKLRGLYLSNYIEWQPNENTEFVIKKYGFKIPKYKFDRTYRKMSNLDDIHENGIHDYMKYIKFGFGRCTDHSNKDIRSGKITRTKAISLIKKMDHKVPSDLNRWLKYVNWNSEKFFKVADTFRSPKIWWIKNNYWHKQCVWRIEQKFEKVKLSKKNRSEYFQE